VGGSSLRDFIILPWLYGMYQVREFDGVLNEEDGYVVTDNVLHSLAKKHPT
jgi:hypothetical protein